MHDEETYKPRKRQNREEDFDSPLEGLIIEAEQVRNSTKELWRLLMEIPQNYLDKANNEVAEFYVTYLSLNIVLGRLLDDKNKSRNKDEFEKVLDQASDLLEELRILKNEIDTKLAESAETDPTTGPGEDLAILPTGEFVPNEPLPTGKGEQLNDNQDDVMFRQEILVTNLDPVIEPEDDIFNRSISTLPPEERLLFSDLETQQPRTPEERNLLELFMQFQAGQREALMKPEGGVKKLSQIKDEVRAVLSLAGYNFNQINQLFRNQIGLITKNIASLNSNTELVRREKSKRLDEAYVELLATVTSSLEDSNHRFVRSAATTEKPRSADNAGVQEAAVGEPEKVIPVQPGDEDISDLADTKTDQNIPPAAVLNSGVSLDGDLDLSQVPTLPVSDTLPDFLFGGAVLPTLDNNANSDPEASVVEAELTFEQTFTREKERHFRLKDLCSQNDFLQRLYFSDLLRADRHITAIRRHIPLMDNTGKPIGSSDKFKAELEALEVINNRLQLALEDATPEPQPPQNTEEAPASSFKLDTLPYHSPRDPFMGLVTLAEQNADWREGVGLPADRPTDYLHPSVREEQIDEYKYRRSWSIEARKNFKEAESNYQTELKKFYENRGFVSKTKGAVKTLFGGRPEFPSELEKLQAEYKYQKKRYAEQLRNALVTREGASAGNRSLDVTQPVTKRAFAKKFVIEPRYRLLDVQAEALETNAQNSKLKPIMDQMRKHRVPLRWLGLLAAAGIGAATGGAMVAGLNMARWGVSTFGGVAVANAVYKQKEKAINKASSELSLEKERIENEFTFEEINEYDESLDLGRLKVERAKLKQKVYATGAAVIVGGAAYVGTSLIDAPSVQAEALPNEKGVKLPADEAIKLEHDKRTLEIEQRVESIRKSIEEANARGALEAKGVAEPTPTPESSPAPKPASTPSNAPETLPAKPKASEVIPNGGKPLSSSSQGEVMPGNGSTPETLLQMRRVKVPHYSPGGELLSETAVSNIKLRGISTDVLRGAMLPDAKVNEIYSALNTKVNDLLAARPNFSQAELESLLFRELQNTYGKEDWWTAANINEVKIDSIITEDPRVGNLIGVQAQTFEVNPVETLDPGESIIKAGTSVADVLPAKASIETLAMEPNLSTDQAPVTYARSGGLVIDADSPVQSLPIQRNILETVSPTIEATGGVPAREIPLMEITQPKLVRPEITSLPSDPNLYSFSGNFTKSPDFVKYVETQYGGLAKFNKILTNQALLVEGETYDGFNSWLNEYRSPYQTVLAKLTIGDLKEAFDGPEIGNKNVEVDGTGLPKSYNTDAIRQWATDNNFKYETVRGWLVKLEDLKQEFPHSESTTVEDLFAESFIKKDWYAQSGGKQVLSSVGNGKGVGI